MASYRAVAAITEAVMYLLESRYAPAKFDGNQLDFEQPMDAGVSLFLYRIYTNDTHRTPKGRIDPNGQRYRTQLPLDLHFLLTAWGKDASLQHTIAGWMMRVLEDVPVFPAGLLNKSVSNVFHPDETVEISLTQLTTEELFRIWEVIGNNAYQISVPYVARYIKIESERLLVEGEAIQERTLDIWELENP
jgi:hypothetical protein